MCVCVGGGGGLKEPSLSSFVPFPSPPSNKEVEIKNGGRFLKSFSNSHRHPYLDNQPTAPPSHLLPSPMD